MTDAVAAAPPSRPRRWLRSIGAILAGFATVVMLSLATDHLLHMLQVYPPWGEPMHAPGLNLLALSYRIVFTVLGGYLAATLAPRAPMGHAIALGIVGLLPGVAGIIATADLDLGPRWFPIAIALTGPPCCWLGGMLHRVRNG